MNGTADGAAVNGAADGAAVNGAGDGAVLGMVLALGGRCGL